MKQPITKYLLGATLFAIWGLVAYKMYIKLSPERDIFASPVQISKGTAPQPSQSYSLLVDYRDPFLEEQMKKTKAVQVSTPSRAFNNKPERLIRKEKENALKAVQFPKIEYKGNIKTKSGKITALVNVQGEFVNWAEGQEVLQMELNKIYSDSIKVTLKGAERVIVKNSK